jgi:hypothetical protein
MTDGRCRFGPRAKREMVARVLAGESARRVARVMSCSPTTVTSARDRWQRASAAERASGAWCAPRRPVPRCCSWALSELDEQRILDARARTNWGPMRLAALVGRHRATVWKVLKRHGVSRRRRGTRQTFRRFEWSQPGALLHIDAYGAPKFLAPRASRDRRSRQEQPGSRPGQDRGDRRPRRSQPAGLRRAAQRRERHQRRDHPHTRRGLDARAGLRARRGGPQRQRQVLHRPPVR